MSRRVWDLAGCTTFAWLALGACGKVEGPHDASGGADVARAGSSEGGGESDAGSGSGGGGRAGAATSTAGKPAANGGASGRGGDAAVGGTGDVRGGGPSTLEAGTSGEGGEGGEGGASACGSHYLSCGCGCCAGSATRPQRCAYPGVGRTIDELIGDDLALQNDSAACAAAGCSLGVDYYCCEPPPPQVEMASYETSVYIGGYDRLRLNKIGAVNCSTFALVSPKTPGEDPPVELPTSWAIDQITRQPCISSAIGPRAIGAIGKLSLRVSGDACVVDAHVTAFFVNAQGKVDAERFDADGVPVNLSVAFCK